MTGGQVANRRMADDLVKHMRDDGLDVLLDLAEAIRLDPLDDLMDFAEALDFAAAMAKNRRRAVTEPGEAP